MSAGPLDFAFTDSGTGSTPKNTTIGSGADTLVLKISQDAFQGSAQYTVSVDGKQIGGVLTASSLHGSGQDDTITVKGSFATGTHTLTVNFLNDLYAGTPTTDRNLYVDGVAFNGAAVPGATAALLSAGPQNFAFAGRPTVTIAPTDTNPVVNLSHVDIVATSGNHSLFIGGSFDTARLTGGTEAVQAFQGHNTIVTAAGNDTVQIAGTGNVVNAGGGTNHLEDSGSGNRIIMPVHRRLRRRVRLRAAECRHAGLPTGPVEDHMGWQQCHARQFPEGHHGGGRRRDRHGADRRGRIHQRRHVACLGEPGPGWPAHPLNRVKLVSFCLHQPSWVAADPGLCRASVAIASARCSSCSRSRLGMFVVSEAGRRRHPCRLRAARGALRRGRTAPALSRHPQDCPGARSIEALERRWVAQWLSPSID